MKCYYLLGSFFILFFVILRSEFTYGENHQRLSVSEGQRIVFAHVGHPVELVCPLEPSEALTFVDWTREGRALYMEPGYTITSRGALRIRAAAPRHAGTYTCEGVNGYGFVPVNITLIVDNPEVENVNFTGPNQNSVHRTNIIPPVIRKRISGSATVVSVEVGGEASLHCVASGHPQPHLFWFRDGHLLAPQDSASSRGRVHSTLRLRRVAVSARYKCIARNKGGEDHLDYSVVVTDVPKAPQILTVEPREAVIKEGEPAIFWCIVNSKPGLKLHIKWLKELKGAELGSVDEDKVFRSGSGVYRPLQISADPGSSSGQNKAKLLIRNSLARDSGTYVCLALNDKGFNVRNVSLTVVEAVLKRSLMSDLTENGLIIGGGAVVVLAALSLFLFCCCRLRRTPRGGVVHPPDQHLKKDPHVACQLLYDPTKGQTVKENPYILT